MGSSKNTHTDTHRLKQMLFPNMNLEMGGVNTYISDFIKVTIPVPKSMIRVVGSGSSPTGLLVS